MYVLLIVTIIVFILLAADNNVSMKVYMSYNMMLQLLLISVICKVY